MRAVKRVPSVVLFACWLSSCATAGGGGVEGWMGTFPSPEKLAALTESAPPAAPKQDPLESVAVWTMAGPFPDRVGQATMHGGDPVADIVIGAATAAKTSEPLQCAARELGRFFAHTGKRPEPRLERYVLLRCGSSSESARLKWLIWDDVDAKVTDVELLEHSRGAIVDAVKQLAKDGRRVGAAMVRDPAKKTAQLFFAAAAPDVELEAAPQAPDQGAYVVAGKLVEHTDADVVYAWVTQGALGAAECTRDFSVVLPAFRFTCAIDPGDASALIDIDARPQGRILSTTVGSVLVVQKPDVARAWTRADVAPPVAMPALDSLAASFLALVNDVRARAGVAALAETREQSATAKALAPYYFNGVFAAEPNEDTLNTVALGLIAGRDVKDIVIHDAGFLSLVDFSGRVDQLVADALERPMLRKILLDKDASTIALGPRALDNGTGILVTTYTPLIPPKDPVAKAAQMFEMLRSERQQRGLGPVLGRVPLDELMLDASRRMQMGDDVHKVEQDVLQASVDKMQRGMALYELELFDTDHIAFPEKLLTAQTTYVAMSVATHRLKGSPWGSTVVLIVYVVDSAARTASLQELEREREVVALAPGGGHGRADAAHDVEHEEGDEHRDRDDEPDAERH